MLAVLILSANSIIIFLGQVTRNILGITCSKLHKELLFMKRLSLFGSIVLGLYVMMNVSAVDAAMSYEKALLYQEKNENDVHVVIKKQKDIYGEKNKRRYFSLLSANGLMHTGKTSMGVADRTLINYVIDYGFANIPSEPYAYIRWAADLAGNPEKGYEPKTLQIVFADNFIKVYNLQGWEYRKEFVPGFFFNSIGHNYNGRIKLNRFDIYEMYQHGDIVSASIDAGNGHIKHFFYSGDKDKKEKETLTRAIVHSMKILQIDPNNMQLEYEAYKKQLEEERKANLRAEIEKEIEQEAEREALKKQILLEKEQQKMNKSK